MHLKLLNGCSGCLRVLMCLYMDGAAGKVPLRKMAGIGQDALDRALQVLSDLKLVEVSQERRFPFRQLVSLTERGHKLLEMPPIRWGQFLP